MWRPRRLLTVGHSYVVALNRRLPHELARIGGTHWEITVAAPRFVQGDLRPIRLEHFVGEAARLVPVHAHFTTRPHILIYGRELRQLCSQSWDIVHSWEEPFVLASGEIALWCRQGKLVYYTFQNINKKYPPPFNWIERYTVQRCSGWIAAGQTVCATLQRRQGYSHKPHCVIPLGVDVAVFRPDPAAGLAVRRQLGWLAEGPPVIGYSGRFVTEKGIGLLLQVLEQLQQPWRALFVGGGPWEATLRRWASRHGPEQVQIVTGVPHDAVPRYLNAMDLLVAPSQTTPRWREQLGRMLIEAMACGVPVVGSDSGEIPYVVGSAGWIVPEHNLLAWVQAIDRLLACPEQRRELGLAGRERATTLFAWPHIARLHLQFFTQLLES
ncbi:MAG: glycosyltransferase family 4 protein [Thermogemmata sp.]|nr:glycosyltransferase family 4 protein [Thermogemmata sp.]